MAREVAPRENQEWRETIIPDRPINVPMGLRGRGPCWGGGKDHQVSNADEGDEDGETHGAGGPLADARSTASRRAAAREVSRI